MSQRFVKGATNNHLTWVMVDATDFATPESALSAATKIKIYGKLKSATGVNFVSSGTGSLTNDIQHVGASALGIYTIALAKADLSDASAAWYDQYVISLSATGAAYQALVVNGGILESYLSDIASYLSNIVSNMSGVLSDVRSNVSDLQSDFQSRVPKAVATNSQLSDLHSDLRSFLVVMSGIQSDLYSAVSDLQSDFQSRVPKRVATDSQLSDLHSDLRSFLVVMSGVQSDIYSAVSDLQSDFQSRVPKRVATDSQLSDVHSDLRSYLVALSDVVSNAYSGVQSLRSAFIGHEGSTASQVADASALEIDGIDHDDQFNGYYVKILGGSQVDELRLVVDTDKTNSKITVKPAFLSRLASAVDFVIVAGNPFQSKLHSDIQSRASQLNSRVLLNQSRISDVYSAVSDLQSDFQSRVPKAVATNSQLSDLHSDLRSFLVVMSGVVSDVYSGLSDFQSDFSSRVPKRVATDSQLSDLHSDLRSFLVAMSGTLSDVESQIDAGVSLDASTMSDLRSAISAGPAATITASDISDIASAVWAAKYTTHSAASSFGSLFSDIYSRVVLIQSAASDAASAAAQGNSRILLVQSRLSDLDSRLTSDVSDIVSALTALSGAVSDAHSAAILAASHASDAQSQAAVGSSRVLLIQSRLSDLDSRLASDASDIYSGVQSLRSALIGHEGSTASQVTDASVLEIDGIDHNDQFNGYYLKVLGGSQIDELRLIVDTDKTNSKITVKPAFLSRLASAVDFVIVAGNPFQSKLHSDVMSQTSQVNSRVLLNQSRISDVYSMLSDLQSDFQSRVPKRVATDSQLSDVQSDLRSYLVGLSATLSDVESQIDAGISLDASTMSDLRSAVTATELDASDLSDVASAVWAHTIGARVDSRVLLNQSRISDVYSLLSDFQSDFGSRVPKEPAARSQVSDLASDLRSYLVGLSASLSDVESQIDAGVLIDASTMSDLRSAITAAEFDASDISDVASAVWATARVEPTAVVSPTGTMKTAIEWLTALSRNKITQTATVQSLRNDADSADIASAAVSDDLTTFTRGEFGN